MQYFIFYDTFLLKTNFIFLKEMKLKKANKNKNLMIIYLNNLLSNYKKLK